MLTGETDNQGMHTFSKGMRKTNKTMIKTKIHNVDPPEVHSLNKMQLDIPSLMKTLQSMLCLLRGME